MSDNKFISGLSKKKYARVFAWIGLIIIGALIIATFITGITGSKYFMGCLWLTIIVPILFYVFIWMGKVLSDVADSKKENIEKE